ncbi:MAG: type IV secretion system DNA-binding domain-containing protein [Thiofilum sp.]|uniref:FtsK/SpoIIIE domain-containing protein n=1 Tax=Thiofilum sp. TaxID=2212733 RepID=UPI0025CEC70F|nr:FtsK/SpoIIIE domain-containing protein [Thiofilum sp.]MBK8455366.1 type IV secretion system DNA-binding domain-containing protein [Thiofilum sp.]
MFIGKFNPDSIIPKSYGSMAGIALAAISTALLTDSPAMTVGALGALYLANQYRTRDSRDGYLFDSPLDDLINAPDAIANVNDLVTERLRKATGNKDLIALESRSAQYRLFKISTDNPQELAKALPRVASVLGIAPDELGFIPTAARDLSIILAPLPRSEWQAVPFDESQLKPNELIGYVGLDVQGQPVTYHRQQSPHMLISGTTGAGKTEVIRADMHAMRLSGLNPEIYIIDAKGTLRRESCNQFTADMNEGLEILTEINQRARERMQEIVKADCDNWFEYKKKCPAICPNPILVYIDEYPQLRALNKDAVELALGELLRVHRSAGVFVTLGIQKPKADQLPTEMRDMLDVRLALRVPDKTASLVAIDEVGAEGLVGEGAFLFRVGGHKLVQGRGVFMAKY